MEHSIYISGIKKFLKTQKITYGELAQQMKMTESGVKKMLTAKDISFRRILQICEILDILPGQLFSFSEKSAIKEVELTREQEETLLKNPQLLAAYWCLTIEKKSLLEIERTQKLSPPELKKSLRRLVTIGLLKERKGNFTATHTGKFKWSDDSRLAQYLNREWSHLILKKSLDSKSRTPKLHRLSTLRLTNESFEQLKEKLTKLFTETAQESEREEVTAHSQNLSPVTLLAAVVCSGIYSE